MVGNEIHLRKIACILRASTPNDVKNFILMYYIEFRLRLLYKKISLVKKTIPK